MQHIPQFRFIFGGHDRKIGNQSRERQVKRAMMRRAVFPYQSSPVQRQNDRQVLQTHIMNQAIIGPL